MTANFVNGPKLAAWLKERDRLPMRLGGDDVDALYRRVYAWEHGDQASVVAADRWLTFLGCHLSELPDDFWEERAEKPYRRYTAEERAEILRLVEQGASVTEIANERGMHTKTIWSWMRRAGIRRRVAA